MKTNNLYFFIIILLLLGLSTSSCVKDVDFNQAENLAFSPILDASLLHFEEPASSFVDDDGTERVTIVDSVDIDVFQNQYVVDNLIKAELLFESTNTINRAYEAKVEFFDAENVLQYTFTYAVPRSPDNLDVVVTHLEVFENDSLIALKATEKLVLTLILEESEDGSILTENSPGELKFRSKGTFYLNIDTSA